MTIRDFVAVTQSGAIYSLVDGIMHTSNSSAGGDREAIKVLELKAVDRDTARSWDDVHNSPDVELPVVGKAIYVSGVNNYRLSTDVVSVRELS